MSTSTSPTTNPATSPEVGPTYTLAALVAEHGTAAVEEVEAFLEGATDAELVAEGAKVATPRITTDTTRLYGIASNTWRRATPVQRSSLAGCSDDRLRISVWCAAEGDRAWQSLHHESSAIADEQEAQGSRASAVRSHALLVREQLHSALVGLTGRNAELVARVEKAFGSAAAPDKALTAMTALVRTFLANPSDAMKRRAAGTSLTPEWLDAADALAAEVAATATNVAGALRKGSVSQGDVDRWDGRNLALLHDLIGIFAAAHDIDPSIPVLTPIALRTHFGRRTRAKVVAPPAVAPPAPPAPPAPAPPALAPPAPGASK
ncbi:MAG: hypothetical protein WCI05_13860 [Myxococcales bacterium]